MGRRKDKYTKATVTFRIGLDTDNRINDLRRHLIQKTGMRSLFGGTPIKATRSQMVEQGIADLWERKSYEHHKPDHCGYCKQPRNVQDQFNDLNELYIDLKELYSNIKSVDHGSETVHTKKNSKP
jgi:hypothetical protein